MAERLARHLCRSVEGWTFSSAGVFASAGAPASAEAIQALAEKGLDLSDHRSTPLNEDLLNRGDWIIPMTAGHRRLILEQVPDREDRVTTLHGFSRERPDRDVMDPVGGSLDAYRVTRDEIESALTDVILNVIRPSS